MQVAQAAGKAEQTGAEGSAKGTQVQPESGQEVTEHRQPMSVDAVGRSRKLIR